MKFWVDLEGLDELIRDLLQDTAFLGEDLRIVIHDRDLSGNSKFLVKLRKGQIKRLLPIVSKRILEERYNDE